MIETQRYELLKFINIVKDKSYDTARSLILSFDMNNNKDEFMNLFNVTNDEYKNLEKLKSYFGDNTYNALCDAHDIYVDYKFNSNSELSGGKLSLGKLKKLKKIKSSKSPKGIKRSTKLKKEKKIKDKINKKKETKITRGTQDKSQTLKKEKQKLKDISDKYNTDHEGDTDMFESFFNDLGTSLFGFLDDKKDEIDDKIKRKLLENSDDLLKSSDDSNEKYDDEDEDEDEEFDAEEILNDVCQKLKKYKNKDDDVDKFQQTGGALYETINHIIDNLSMDYESSDDEEFVRQF